MEIKFSKQSTISFPLPIQTFSSPEKFLNWYYHDCNKASKLGPQGLRKKTLWVISSKGAKFRELYNIPERVTGSNILRYTVFLN